MLKSISAAALAAALVIAAAGCATSAPESGPRSPNQLKQQGNAQK